MQSYDSASPRKRKGPKPRPVTDRFWAKVNKAGPTTSHRPELGPCWLWTASLGSSGYGQFGLNGHGARPVEAHRVAWMLTSGTIPPGLWVLHRCDVKRCVRPSHLFLGTLAENNRDMYAKGRAVTQTHPEKMARGERQALAKLTAEKVREIRRLHAAGEQNYERLATRFDVDPSTVARVVKGVTWKHVA